MNKQLVKQIFVESATSLFHEKGYDIVTVDDIAIHCNKTRTSFYHYFKSKEDLFIYLSLLEKDNYKRILAEGTAVSWENPEECLRKLLTDKMKLLYKSSFFKIAIKNGLFETIKELNTIRADFDDTLLNFYVKIVKHGISKGVFIPFIEITAFFEFYQKMQKGIELSLFENINEDDFFRKYSIAVNLAVKAISIQKQTEIMAEIKEN